MRELELTVAVGVEEAFKSRFCLRTPMLQATAEMQNFWTTAYLT